MLHCAALSTETFFKNPQFQLVLSEKDEGNVSDDDDGGDDDDDGDEDGVEDDEVLTPKEKKKADKQKQKAKQCTVLVEVLQKNRRQQDKTNFLYIAFHIYRVRRSLFSVTA